MNIPEKEFIFDFGKGNKRMSEKKIRVKYKKTYATVPPTEVLYFESFGKLIYRMGKEIKIMPDKEIFERDDYFSRGLEELREEFMQILGEKITEQDIVKEIDVLESLAVKIILTAEELEVWERRALTPMRDRALKIFDLLVGD